MSSVIEAWDPNLAVTPRAGLFRSGFGEYLRTKAVSRTILHELEQTPAHAFMKMHEPSESSPALDFGEAFHTLILEPDRAEAIIVAEEGMTRRQKAWDEFQRRVQMSGGVPVTNEEERHLVAMRRAIMAEPGVKRLIESPLREITVVWQHERTKLWCKARVDLLDLDSPSYALDLKTTAEADPRRFAYSCRDYGYTLQAGMYLEGLNTVLGADAVKGFIVLAVEKEPPYRREWYDMRKHVEAGTRRYHELMELYAECSSSGVWPAMHRRPSQPPTIHELPLL